MPQAPARYDNIDLVRGLVMVFMAIDHVRDYLAPVADPMDLASVSPLLFHLRWLAHFCAPVFAFLMGVSAWIGSARRTPGEFSRQMILRGLLLVVLEFTVVDLAWNFYPAWPRKFFQVIAALGLGLVLLGAVSRLGRVWVLALGGVIVCLHNLTDGVSFPAGTWMHYLWSFVHQRNVLPLGGGWEVRTSYPFLPIAGVALVGYGLAPWVTRGGRPLAWMGGAALALFALLRLGLGYGDPHPFAAQPSAGATWLAVWNTTKYPLSLQFVLMTLGPALIVLAWWRTPRAPFTLLGRVPLFFYVAHITAIHLAILAIAWRSGFPPANPAVRFGGVPAGFTLPVWNFVPFALLIVALLYPACRWYERLRRSGRYPLLAYL